MFGRLDCVPSNPRMLVQLVVAYVILVIARVKTLLVEVASRDASQRVVSGLAPLLRLLIQPTWAAAGLDLRLVVTHEPLGELPAGDAFAHRLRVHVVDRLPRLLLRVLGLPRRDESLRERVFVDVVLIV